MNSLEVLLIAISMAMDAFAVSLGIGADGQCEGIRPRFRLIFHFGLFQFLLPIAGWFAGLNLVRFIESFDHWVAFALLVFVGGRMIRSGFDGVNSSRSRDPSRGWTMLLLSVAVSIDALAVGFSLALIDVNIWYPAVIIGLVTGLLSLVGLKLGTILGRKFGKQMEIVGGLVLIFIGLRIVIGHLSG
ncbi:MAG TPA: manganese efflux pump MntP family protein [Anaerolineales bacterium]|nr:manganese efflux pump MntP family protein [Anaerolineales bacterium]